ncbi:MAG: rod shape-determining protein, partial [Desulfomonilaceae bacterium]
RQAPSETLRVTGREAGKGGLKNILINSTEISNVLESPINSIIDLIQEVLDNASPAVLADLENSPVVLVGGLSLLQGLSALIAKMTGFQVVVAANPLYASLKGCSTIVDDPVQHVYCIESA